MRSLPQVTGPTERALSALLDRELARSRVPGFLAWVALNLSGAKTPASLGTELDRMTQCGAREADITIEQLVALGLLDSEGALTAEGSSELRSLRARVNTTTRAVVADIPDDDLATTIDVLDRVRSRAEALLQA